MNKYLKKCLDGNPHKLQKYRQLEQLASEVKDGVIVELGTYLGYGAIALATGATVPVFTIDDYTRRWGWAGERYSSFQKWDFQRNIKQAGIAVSHIQANAREATQTWKQVGLLFWDLGMKDRLLDDFKAWQDKVIGRFVIHDTEDGKLGSGDLNPDGWKKSKDGVLWILDRE